ncbi:unnamed protein product [Protopolystoma xenopodis]|uniref:Phosphatidylinositol transfer protein N-terminal domain-containing protein n=1 Tax=Protopolystoma xenopodis TaxID=117903 RepID=A0A3S5AHC7_9PLAT|nr:unnamed protein product [Protopolystoma xenopodis]
MVSSGDYKEVEDPTIFVSQVTGRGPLSENWTKEHSLSQKGADIRYSGHGISPARDGLIIEHPLPKRIMCAYKLCRVEFRYWGMQTKVERFIHDIVSLR